MVAVVAYPALVAAMEYVISRVSPHGTFGSLAYTQADVPALLQLASVAGTPAVSFLISLVPAALAIAWRHRREPRVPAAALALGAGPLAVALLFGFARLAAAPPVGRVMVGLAASDPGAGPNSALEDSAAALAIVRAYAARAAALADRGARVVVLPEKFVGVTPAYADQARHVLARVAREHAVTVVAGFNLIGGAERTERGDRLWSRRAAVLEYDKQHLVPGLEAGYRSGV